MIPVVPRELLDPLAGYLSLLERWNRVHALTALPPGDRMEELIQDSAVLLPFLETLPAGSTVMDLGTGMGVPAVLLALHRPDLRILAVDSSGKKIAFVRQAALELGLANLQPLQGRFQDLPPAHAQAGVSKATASLPLLAGWWERHGEAGAPLLALKGPGWEGEKLPDGWELQIHPYSLPTRGERFVLQMKRRA